MTLRTLKVLAVATAAAATLMFDLSVGAVGGHGGFFTSQAEARVGRPATPVSYAGVARRSARRTIYVTNRYVATLPAGCMTTIINGVSVYQCGSTYYQPSGNQYVIININ